MNLFFLHINPKTAASYHLNRHCVKMILEICQMLYTAHHLSSSDFDNHPDIPVYKKTHANHPTAKWVRQCVYNYDYACTFGIELCLEYTRRYHKQHACFIRLQWLQTHPPLSFDDTPITTSYLSTDNLPPKCTPIPLAMPTEFHTPDAILSYRLYYVIAKQHVCSPEEREHLIRLVDTFELRERIPLASCV